MQPDIPRTSNVIYRPSNTRETTPHPFRMAVKVPQATPDVLLSKTVDLVRRSLRGSNHADLAPRFSDDEEHDDSDQDSQPSGSRRASKRRRRTSPVQPSRRPGPEEAQHFEKELLQELTCEICYMLLYKPITSPCQHVRLPPLYSSFLITFFPSWHLIDFLLQMSSAFYGPQPKMSFV